MLFLTIFFKYTIFFRKNQQNFLPRRKFCSSRTSLAFPNTRKLLDKRLAALKNIAVGTLEIARIPRVGDIARVVSEVKQAADFVVEPICGNSLEIADICGIHSDQIIIFFINGNRNPIFS